MGTVTADKPRGSLVAGQCGGHGGHGFSFETPDTLKDGAPHALYFYAINVGAQGANRLLSDSPKTVNCPPAVTVNLTAPRYPGAAPGGSFPLTYKWSGAPTDKPYKVFVHFVDAAGAIAFRDDHMPPTPTTRWSGPVSYTRPVPVPAAAFGSYRIMAGLYDPATGERLTLKHGPGVTAASQSRHHVGTLTVGSPFGFELFGPVEVVRPVTAQCDVNDLPDLTPRAFRDADGKVNLISSHYITRRMVGASLNDVRIESDCRVVFSSTEDKNFDALKYREWMASTYTLDGRTVYGLIHNEWYGHLSGDPDCIQGPNVTQWVNSITLVVSRDKGVSYAHPEVDYKVVSPPVGWDKKDPLFKCHEGTVIVYGAFAPSNIIRMGNYYYALYQSERDPYGILPSHATCLMRTAQLESGAAWEVWTGGTNWNTSPIAIPAALANIGGIHESVTNNTYLKKYVVIGQTWSPTHAVYLSTSGDLISWSRPLMVTPAPDDFSNFIYPALLDPTDTSRNFENTGQTPYFYYVRKVGGDNMKRELVRQKIRLILPAG